MMKIINSCVVILSVCIVAILCMGISRTAGKSEEAVTVVRTYVVQQGDGYWDVAWFYHRQQTRYEEVTEFADAIKRSNNYKELHPGDVLEIPLESHK